MRLILERDGVKRQIDGPFAMLVDRADAQRLISILEARLALGHTYGWFVVDDAPQVEQGTNTPVAPWTSESNPPEQVGLVPHTVEVPVRR